jgi:hypothetical protein
MHCILLHMPEQSACPATLYMHSMAAAVQARAAATMVNVDSSNRLCLQCCQVQLCAAPSSNSSAASFEGSSFVSCSPSCMLEFCLMLPGPLLFLFRIAAGGWVLVRQLTCCAQMAGFFSYDSGVPGCKCYIAYYACGKLYQRNCRNTACAAQYLRNGCVGRSAREARALASHQDTTHRA